MCLCPEGCDLQTPCTQRWDMRPHVRPLSTCDILLFASQPVTNQSKLIEKQNNGSGLQSWSQPVKPWGGIAGMFAHSITELTAGLPLPSNSNPKLMQIEIAGCAPGVKVAIFYNTQALGHPYESAPPSAAYWAPRLYFHLCA